MPERVKEVQGGAPMPRIPNGERRPANSNSCAVMVAKLLTGELEEESDDYMVSVYGTPFGVCDSANG